jgi:NAD(P)-dependent dehydrogenase (short-subunit alcohol dehydrogenase family)
MDISGKIVAVTGGGHGIGKGLAQRFAAEGAAAVAVLDLDGAGAQRVADEIGGWGRQVDVTDEREITDAIDAIESELGPIDLFCSNAGILSIGGVELDTDEYRRVMEVNVYAHLHAARVLVPRMIERGGGYLLNTASAAGLLTQIGSAPYSVTKHAAVALAEWIAITYGDRGINVSVLCPQAVRTAMTGGTEEGGVAGVDGMLEPAQVADAVIQGLATEQFLILPHAEVATYFKRKADDYDRWLAGMRRLQSRFVDFSRPNPES